MMAFATRYDVSAHVASSVVADMLLAMCGSDTLTTVVSSTSMKVANITAIATIQGLTFPCSVTGHVLLSLPCHVSTSYNGRRHGHAGTQDVLVVLPRVEKDLHGHALDDLDVVAGGVVRRQQAEARAGRRRRCCRLPANVRPP